MKFVTDPLCASHLRGVAHPERPDRVEAVGARLRDEGLLGNCIAARDVTDEELARVHARAYLDLVERETDRVSGPRYLSTGDTVIDAGSYVAARRSAGGAVAAALHAAAARESVFALVRPPGHHAEPDRGMGFCLYNNVAVAARAYRAAYGGRVLVIDIDYHHGNGTEAVAGDGLSYISTHAYPAYPGTGTASYRRGDDLVVNLPLPATGLSTEAFVAVWSEALPAVARAVRPNLILVSAGFDYVCGDSVGDLGVGVEAASGVAAAIRAVADDYAEGAVAYVLEGGYGLDAVARSIASIASVHDAPMQPQSDADHAAVPPGVRDVMCRSLRRVQGSP